MSEPISTTGDTTSDTWDFYLRYLDNLEALDQARAQQDRLARENVALRDDPFVKLTVGVWGSVIRPLSEWDAFWDEQMLPLLDLAHLGSMERPWARALDAYRKRKRYGMSTTRKDWKDNGKGADTSGVCR